MMSLEVILIAIDSYLAVLQEAGQLKTGIAGGLGAQPSVNCSFSRVSKSKR